MTRYITLLSLLVSACANTIPASERTPSATTVARIERKLSKDPCSGALAGLSRTYAFPWRSGSVDDRTIFVTLQATDSSADVIIMPPNRAGSQTEGTRGWGIYDVRNDRLTLARCPNAT
jgi:hypothetical protein